ncbi:Paramyosin [Madurella fahalii]|uniref:Paramyosin n=1 Tax=Madurella fahalii TaxID=1157608 RepID=A0ABQ0G5Q2_9PEZI
MFQRSSDAYSRRPAEDDRRGSDPRDRRRETYARRGSDLYKDDRFRRDTDSSPKDSRYSSDSPRGPPPPTRTRSDSAINPTRSELGTRALPTPQSLADSPGLDRSNVRERLVKLWKKQAEAIAEVAKLRAERDPLERVLRARQAEYEKSMVKHADYPSVPELQNMHRRKYADQVQVLDRQLQGALNEVDKTTEAFASIISSLAWVQSRQQDTQSLATTDSSEGHETLSKQQAEINNLKAQLCQMKAQRCKEQEEFKRMKEEVEEMRNGMKRDTKEQDNFKRMKEEMEDMKNEMKREIKELKAEMRGAKQEVNEDIDKQLGTLREEFEQWQLEQKKSQQNSMQSRFQKQEMELKRLIKQQLWEDRNGTDNVSSAQVSALIQQGSSVLRTSMDDCLKRVDELTAQLTQQTLDTANLRECVAAHNQRLDGQVQKVEEHEAKLSKIDFDALEGVAETMSFEFPNLRRKFDDFQSSMDKLAQEAETKHNDLSTKVHQFSTKIAEFVGQLVDEVRRETAGYGARIKALEGASGSSNGLSTPEVHPAKVAADTMKAEVASIKTDVDSTKAVVDRLTQDHAGLSAQINQVNQDMARNNKDLNSQIEMLRFSITVLDSQFSNLSTKSLAEHIIGQLELVYPASRELVADVSYLRTTVDGLIGRVKELEDELRDYKGKLDGFGGVNGTSLPGCRENLRRTAEFPGNGISNKRRRIDSSPSGPEHPISNGAG